MYFNASRQPLSPSNSLAYPQKALRQSLTSHVIANVRLPIPYVYRRSATLSPPSGAAVADRSRTPPRASDPSDASVIIPREGSVEDGKEGDPLEAGEVVLSSGSGGSGSGGAGSHWTSSQFGRKHSSDE